jgi:hypothetical protein
MNLPCDPDQIEFVIWRDAVDMSSRAHITELDKLRCACNTNLGWPIHENEDRVVFAHGTSDTGEVDHFVIPRSCIIERIPIIPRKGRKKTK